MLYFLACILVGLVIVIPIATLFIKFTDKALAVVLGLMVFIILVAGSWYIGAVILYKLGYR